ncbi:hypothetical protein PpBr36_08992 [Pyricularia pennisetigena]|uniref:hypothetical protein n=1 Tax=Pyricularia pennisetigena TaxID=1578925 RepID=UPI00114F97C3|nr:hypothetical protein PpBr36_08992 [Pyricularia pennisetigena]TLS23866.1 hypothetical protein PpBr36_08992 [Pyricularia pennisetigena]
MGVNGLWQVLQPCARPTKLETLNRKRLAVDASIWIYQFLKAVRDKEGNALRNSHVIGFFRRICKLLWFGIKPVFVFDGGAPVLKRATLQGRKRRREGRREDAVRTANKLLAVQMQRLAEAEAADRRTQRSRAPEAAAKATADAAAGDVEDGVAEGEVIPDAENIVYADEQLLDKTERQKNRKFFKQDAYHLPALEKSMHEMGKPNDPRVMSIEELEIYAQQFHKGEDINLYDFSKIDFDGDFFKSLPSADRYNILNAARLRSRLRMGLSKEQLMTMFPNRRDFSRFQVERVQERNRLTQRLMVEIGMSESTDLTVSGRINSERGREYILVKNDGAEGGWALGVVTREKDKGEAHNPIDVDAPARRNLQQDGQDDEWEDSDEFEDVPIEGLNRLPKVNKSKGEGLLTAEGIEEDSMFVDQAQSIDDLFEDPDQDEDLAADEQEDINRAIAMSLKNQHGSLDHNEGDIDTDGKTSTTIPEWEQKAAEKAKPINGGSGRTIAHIVNNRASRMVPKPRVTVAPESQTKADVDTDSDSDDDLMAIMAKARKNKQKQQAASKPAVGSVTLSSKNPFGGPLPFEKLDWRTSVFEPKPTDVNNKGGFLSADPQPAALPKPSPMADRLEALADEDDEAEGGFERPAPEAEGPRPLPPWMLDTETDIRDSVKNQAAAQADMNAEDRQLVMEERQRYQKELAHQYVEIESSEESGDDDIEIIEAPTKAVEPSQKKPSPVNLPESTISDQSDVEAPASLSGGQQAINEATPAATTPAVEPEKSVEKEAESPPSSPEPEFEDVEITAPEPTNASEPTNEAYVLDAPTLGPLETGDVDVQQIAQASVDDAFNAIQEFDDFSDSEDEELLAQLAEEAEAHAEFASTLQNHGGKSAANAQSAEDYEKELKQLRAQQKKDRRDADEVSQVMVTECQQLLRLFGIPYVTAPMEAEAQCAELVRLGLVDGIVTDDSDTFLFGGTRVYKNMFNGNKFVECYLASDLEKELSLSRENLISLAQLLGSDYTDGLPGVGPVTAVEILSEFPGPDGLSRFAEWWRQVQSSLNVSTDGWSSFLRKFRKSQATRLFLPPGFPSPAVPEAYLKPEVDSDPEPFQWGAPDLSGLRDFLMATIGWTQERTDEVLVPVIRDVNRRELEGTQSNITRFFSGGVGVGARQQQENEGQQQGEAFAPRRAARGGSKRMANAVSRLRAQASSAGAPTGGSDGDTVETPASVRGSTRKRKARADAIVEEDEDGHEGTDDDSGQGTQEAHASARGGRRKRGRAVQKKG